MLGDRPGDAPRPHLVLSAHLDTVFPEETNVKVTRRGQRLEGPGIGDNCRGLAVLVAVIRSMNQAVFERRERSRLSPTSEKKDSAICAG